jgi:hypothetical protein
MKALVFCALFIFAVFSAAAQPAKIIIIRHAEKPPDDNKGSLSLKGQERAMALVPFLTEMLGAKDKSSPPFLFATKIGRKKPDNHTHETLGPLARQLGTRIRAPYANSEYEALARELLSDRVYEGRTVLICWTHTHLPELVKALGVSPELPAWDENVFDRVLVVTFEGGKAKMENLPQKLLYGDSAN